MTRLQVELPLLCFTVPTSTNANCFGFRLDVYDSAGQELPLSAAMARSTVARIETMSSSCPSVDVSASAEAMPWGRVWQAWFGMDGLNAMGGVRRQGDCRLRS